MRAAARPSPRSSRCSTRCSIRGYCGGGCYCGACSCGGGSFGRSCGGRCGRSCGSCGGRCGRFCGSCGGSCRGGATSLRIAKVAREMSVRGRRRKRPAFSPWSIAKISSSTAAAPPAPSSVVSVNTASATAAAADPAAISAAKSASRQSAPAAAQLPQTLPRVQLRSPGISTIGGSGSYIVGRQRYDVIDRLHVRRIVGNGGQCFLHRGGCRCRRCRRLLRCELRRLESCRGIRRGGLTTRTGGLGGAGNAKRALSVISTSSSA